MNHKLPSDILSFRIEMVAPNSLEQKPLSFCQVMDVLFTPNVVVIPITIFVVVYQNRKLIPEVKRRLYCYPAGLSIVRWWFNVYMYAEINVISIFTQTKSAFVFDGVSVYKSICHWWRWGGTKRYCFVNPMAYEYVCSIETISYSLFSPQLSIVLMGFYVKLSCSNNGKSRRFHKNAQCAKLWVFEIKKP